MVESKQDKVWNYKAICRQDRQFFLKNEVYGWLFLGYFEEDFHPCLREYFMLFWGPYWHIFGVESFLIGGYFGTLFNQIWSIRTNLISEVTDDSYRTMMEFECCFFQVQESHIVEIQKYIFKVCKINLDLMFDWMHEVTSLKVSVLKGFG